jgi:hypothetical protein
MDRHRRLYQALLDNDIRHWGDRFLAALTGYEMNGVGKRVSSRQSAGDGGRESNMRPSLSHRPAGVLKAGGIIAPAPVERPSTR